MRNLARNYPVITYVIITFIYSWGLWLLMILSQKGLLPFPFATNWTGSFGPAVGALITTALIGGRQQVNSLLRRIIQVKAGLIWYVYSLLLIVAIHALSILLFSIITRSMPQIKLLGLNDLLMVLVYFPIIMIIGGPLGEEIGWRGFLQAKLRERWNPIITSLLIGIIWSIWHYPLIYLEGAAQKGESFLMFALTVIPISFLFTILYEKTNGSLFLALLFHTSINTYSYVVQDAIVPSLKGNDVAAWCLIAVLWFMALILTYYSNKKKNIR